MPPTQAYTQSQISTSSAAEVMVLLYRGAVRFVAKARLHRQNGDNYAAHQALIPAQEIILQIMTGLRPSPNPLDADLYALHNYVYEVLYRANADGDPALIDEALKHLRDQLDTWEQLAMPGRRPTAGGVISIDRHC